MTKQEAREYVANQKWIWAKSYAMFAPHEYILRGKGNAGVEQFYDMSRYILEHGIRMFYYKNERKYLFLDGYFYWLMVNEVSEKTNIINRCKPEDYDIVFMKRGTQAGKNARVMPKYEQMTFGDD